MNDKKVRDWTIPGFISGLTWIALWYAVELAGTQVWELIIFLVGVVSLAACIANFSEYVSERRLTALDRQNSVLTYSADVRLFEAARGLASQSPELAGELAKKVGRPDLIIFPSRQGRRVLARLAGSEVTMQFCLKCLDLSDDVYMAAMRNFGDGTYLYDPNREITDRQQWKQFNWLLAQEGIVTRYVPDQATNSAPMWLPPWTPARIRENWLGAYELRDVFKPLEDAEA